jgi:hypothetical protein
MRGSECVCRREVKLTLLTCELFLLLVIFRIFCCKSELSLSFSLSLSLSLLLNFKQAFQKHKYPCFFCGTYEPPTSACAALSPLIPPCGGQALWLPNLDHSPAAPCYEPSPNRNLSGTKGAPNGRRARSKRILLALRVVFLRGHSRRCQAADRRSSNPDRQSLAPIEGSYPRPQH